MRQAFIGISKVAMNGLYRLFAALSRRRDEVLFLSRQADEPSYDFVELGKQVQAAGWSARMLIKNIRATQGASGSQNGAGLLAYGLHVIKELWLLAHCKLVVLDRYDPVISLLDFNYKDTVTTNTHEGTTGDTKTIDEPATNNSFALHTEYPQMPQILQLWHAFGSYKKFGYQSIGVPEGHLQQTLDTFNIHRNYTWIACSGEGARDAFAEAFSYQKERVVVFTRPEYFRLKNAAKRYSLTTRKQERPLVLFAPTLRKSTHSPHPFRDLQKKASHLETYLGAQFVWSFHPLDTAAATEIAPDGTDSLAEHTAILPDITPDQTPQLVEKVQVVVTDYSSIAYEAYLLGIPVVFYVADLEEALHSPGLNINPAIVCPALCATTENELTHAIEMAISDPSQALKLLEVFVADAFTGADEAPSNILEFTGLTEHASS